MAEIETFQRRTGFPTGVGAEPISSGDVSALNAPSRAVAQLADQGGEFATALGRKAFVAEGDAQALDGIAAVKSAMLAAGDSLDTNPNPDDYSFDTTYKELDSIAKGIKNRRGRLEVEQYITANKPIWDNNLNDIKTKRRQDNAIAISDQWPSRIKDLDLTSIDGVLEAEKEIGDAGRARLDTGRFAPAEVEGWTENALGVIERQSVFQESLILASTEGTGAGEDYIMGSGISTAEKKKVMSDYNFETARQAEALEAQIQQEENEIESRISQGQPADELINLSLMTADDKHKWRQREYAESARRAKGEEVVVNWDKYGDLQDVVNQYYNGEISKKDARDAVSDEAGKTITEAMAKKFYDDIDTTEDPDAPTNRASYRNADVLINDLTREQFFWPTDIGETPEEATKEELREGLRQNNITGLRIRDELRKWLETQEKEPTDEQVTEKVDELTQPFIENKIISLNWFEKLILAKEGTPFFGRFTGTTEEKRLATKKRKAGVEEDFGLRPDGTLKGNGFLGVLNLKGGGVATEYSVGVRLQANNGKETDIPSLVPTLTQKEINLMVNDIIPNHKDVPEKILQKAVDHANKRVKAGKSPFSEDVPTIATQKEYDALPSGTTYRDANGAIGTKK